MWLLHRRGYVKLIHSILPSDLDTRHATGARESKLARIHGLLSRQGRGAEFTFGGEGQTSLEQARLIETIQHALTAHGLGVNTLVGTGTDRIDLAILDPENAERYILGIELDGATYRAAKTAHERERFATRCWRD